MGCATSGHPDRRGVAQNTRQPLRIPGESAGIAIARSTSDSALSRMYPPPGGRRQYVSVAPLAPAVQERIPVGGQRSYIRVPRWVSPIGHNGRGRTPLCVNPRNRTPCGRTLRRSAPRWINIRLEMVGGPAVGGRALANPRGEGWRGDSPRGRDLGALGSER